jgi:hypothetical protein
MAARRSPTTLAMTRPMPAAIAHANAVGNENLAEVGSNADAGSS